MKRLIWCMVCVTLSIFIFDSSCLAETSGVDGSISWILSDDGVLTINGVGEV